MTTRPRGVVLFGHAASDVLLTPRRHDPWPWRPESPTLLGQPSALGRSAGLRNAWPPFASSRASAFSRLCYSARRAGYKVYGRG